MNINLGYSGSIVPQTSNAGDVAREYIANKGKGTPGFQSSQAKPPQLISTIDPSVDLSLPEEQGLQGSQDFMNGLAKGLKGPSIAPAATSAAQGMGIAGAAGPTAASGVGGGAAMGALSSV